VTEALDDRSILFPIFSGLFLALKFGQIEQDADCTYEQSLVARFVYETRLHGDPVHYTRALAMQGEMFGRLGHFEKAFESFHQLADVYHVIEHSDEICNAYGSDRVAQAFSMSAMWYAQMGECENAVEACWHVINELLPKMDPRNVHNSFCMIYPLLWILKDNGYPLEARDHFIHFVVDAFDEHFGEGRSTASLALFDPIMMVLDLARKVPVEGFDQYVEWALTEENLRFGFMMNCSLGNLGRCADCISAEICLLLAEQVESSTTKRQLLRSGLDLTNELLSLAEAKRMNIAIKDCLAIHEQLVLVAANLRIET